MKTFTKKSLIGAAIVMFLTFVGCAIFWITGQTNSVAAVRALGRSGASEQRMLAAIDESARPKNISADDIIGMKTDGVPDHVIVTLLKKKE